MRLPSIGEVKKFLGSLVAVAGSLVTLGVTGTTAHIISIVSTVAASLLVYILANDPAPAVTAQVAALPSDPSAGRPKG